jgi:hypothetical protein
MDLKKAGEWSKSSAIVASLVVVAPAAVVVVGIGGVAALGVLGPIASVTAAVAGVIGAGVSLTTDAYNSKMRGKVVQVFGPKRVGKNSVYDAITGSSDRADDPTTPSTKELYENSSRAELKILDDEDKPAPPGFFKDIYEVAGESVTKWKELIRETNPHGIIYVTDSSTEFKGKGTRLQDSQFQLEAKGLYEVGQTIKDLRTEGGKKKRLKAFLILVNKADKIPTKEKRDALAHEYKEKLKKHNLEPGMTLFDFLTKALGDSIPIRIEYFCADFDQRETEPYKSNNTKVIYEFWRQLLK